MLALEVQHGDSIIDADGFSHVVAGITDIPAGPMESAARWFRCLDGEFFAVYAADQINAR